MLVRDAQRLGEPPRRPAGDTDVADVTLPHEVIKRAHRLLDRRQIVLAVDLVEVDIVGAEPLQALLYRIHDMAARRAAIVRTGAGCAGALGGQHDIGALAPGVLHRLAGDLLGEALRVDVGGVDEVDARIQRPGNDGVGVGLPDLADIGPDAGTGTAKGHGTEADFGDEQARPPKGLITHGKASFENCDERSAPRARGNANKVRRCRAGIRPTADRIARRPTSRNRTGRSDYRLQPSGFSPRRRRSTRRDVPTGSRTVLPNRGASHCSDRPARPGRW